MTLLFHDPDNPACTALTALYCNRVSHAISNDTFLDRLSYTKGIIKIYLAEKKHPKYWSNVDMVKWLGNREPTTRTHLCATSTPTYQKEVEEGGVVLDFLFSLPPSLPP